MRTIRKFGSMLVIAAFVLTGCRKENVKEFIKTQEEQNPEEVVMTEITDLTDAEYLAVEIEGGTEGEAFSSPNEGLPEVYLLEENSFDLLGKDGGPKFIRCLKGSDLSKEQVMKVRRALAAFHGCKADAVKRHRGAYSELKAKVDHARKELIAQFRNGKITEKEFKVKMMELRKRFHQGVKNIKTSYAHTLRACYGKFLRQIHGILSDRQWAGFTKCLRNR